ncbi:MAG: ATP-binding cassette domain-containing protein [Pseudomonadota bacterium]
MVAKTEIVSSILNAYSREKLSYILSDQVNIKLLNKGSLVHLKQETNISIAGKQIDYLSLIDNMNSDIVTITENNLISGALSHTISGIYACGYLFSSNSIDIILYTKFFKELSNILTFYLSKKVNSYNHYIAHIHADLHNKLDYNRLNADQMDINAANNFTIAKHLELAHLLRKASGKQGIWEIWEQAWTKFNIYSDYLTSWLLISYQIYYKTIEKKFRLSVFEMTQDFANLLSWKASNYGSIINLKTSLLRVKELVSKLDSMYDSSEHFVNYTYNKSDKTSICFDRYKVGIKQESRLYINDLCIEGGIVAFTSASGGGKSTFFKAISNYTQSGVWSDGGVNFSTIHGNNPVFARTSQESFIPPDITLLELITFRTSSNSLKYKEKVIELFNRVNIDNVKENEINLSSSLELKKDWSTVLSGGQKQKVDLIRLILQEEKPDIILLDELFAGLDHESVKIVQDLIKEQFNSSLVIIIDHEAKAHNLYHWYDAEFHLENNTAIMLGSPGL